MTETVNAPQENAEATPANAEGQDTTTATPEKQPVSIGEKITKALGKDLEGTTHPAFIEWVKDNGGPDLDPTSVLATQSLYNVFRQTEEFKQAKAALPKGGGGTTEAPMPKTKEEAEAALKKHAEAQQRREAAAKRADERAAKIQELLASMAGEDSGDEAESEAEPETDEDMQEAF